ncbi:MAG TPA: DNA modification methylase [Spirochaetia bacterium]|nr:DNA modification methylase [Spirochaetia bacterium]
MVGKNEDLIPNILEIYGKNVKSITDLTYGNGNFWKKVDTSKYAFFPSDIKTNGIDFRNLPHGDNSFDMVVFDPPYMHSSPTPIREDLDKTYRNNDKGGWGAEYVYNLYRQGMKESYRILQPKGILLVKCQDQVESGKNYFDHIEIYNIATKELGFLAEDLFVLTRQGVPMMRHPYQLHARKNHSYMWIFRK